MAKKGFKKQKAGTQKTKQRKPRPQGSGGTSSGASSGGGTMGGLRRGLQAIAGTGKKEKGPKTPLQRVFDIALWVAVIVAGYVFFSRQCT